MYMDSRKLNLQYLKTHCVQNKQKEPVFSFPAPKYQHIHLNKTAMAFHYKYSVYDILL